MKSTIQLLGSPDDYRNPHLNKPYSIPFHVNLRHVKTVVSCRASAPRKRGIGPCYSSKAIRSSAAE